MEFGHRRGLRHRQPLPTVSGGARRSSTNTPPVEALGCERDEDDRDRTHLHLRDDVAEETDRDKDGDELSHGRNGSEHRGTGVFDGEQNKRLPEGRRHGDDGNVGKRVRICGPTHVESLITASAERAPQSHSPAASLSRTDPLDLASASRPRESYVNPLATCE